MFSVGRILPLLIIDVTSFIPRTDTISVQTNLQTESCIVFKITGNLNSVMQ